MERTLPGWLQMDDNPVFATRPPVHGIGKTETEERGWGDRFPFAPGEARVGRPIEHLTLADNPAFLQAGETHLQQIRTHRTSFLSGQREIDPVQSSRCLAVESRSFRGDKLAIEKQLSCIAAHRNRNRFSAYCPLH